MHTYLSLVFSRDIWLKPSLLYWRRDLSTLCYLSCVMSYRTLFSCIRTFLDILLVMMGYILLRQVSFPCLRGLLRLSIPSALKKLNFFLSEIYIFTLFIDIFRFFPYITLVNFWFQASGHSFSPRIVIFGLSEPCTIENWRLLIFFENSIFYG